MKPNKNFRSYLISCFVFFTVWGLSLLYTSWVDPTLVWYNFSAYQVIKDIGPFWVWGLINTLIGLAFGVKIVKLWHPKRTKKKLSTVVLIAAATAVTTIWAIALGVTMLMGLNSPLGFLLFGYCAVSHVRVAGFPLVEDTPNVEELRSAIDKVETFIQQHERAQISQ